jgi:predicted acyl esterase
VVRLFVLLLAVCRLEGALAADVVRPRFDVRIPMRDGVELSADMWLPAAEGRHPTVLIRTPYLKNESAREGEFYASHGYALVVQDTRGRGDSDGQFSFFASDDRDGYDTVEWTAAQPWSNGRVGMKGSSYLATVQWLAARERPPHLVCIVPHSPGGLWFHSRPYHGGALVGPWALQWTNAVSGRLIQVRNAENVGVWSPSSRASTFSWRRRTATSAIPKPPGRRCARDSPNQRSTRLSQLELVGTKCGRGSGRKSGPSREKALW